MGKKMVSLILRSNARIENEISILLNILISNIHVVIFLCYTHTQINR